MTFFDLLKHNIVLMLMHFLKIKKYENKNLMNLSIN
jgi:hypothetical protein